MTTYFVAIKGRVRTLTPRQIALAVFLLAFAIRVAAVFATHQYRDPERYELERVSLSLAATGLFGNPYAIPTGPTAHVSPGYPLLLAVIFHVFGSGTTGEIIKQIFASACSAAVCAAIPAVSGIFGLPGIAGLVAAVFTALLPLKMKTETEGAWEAPFATLGLMLVMSLTVLAWREKRLDMRFAIMLGAAWGVVLLFVSAFLSLLMALLAVGFLVNRKEWRIPYLRSAAVVCICAALLLAPWTWRNWRALGSPVIGRDNTGIELRVSNNDYAGPSEHLNYDNGVYHRYHPSQSVAEAEKVRDMGEIAYNQAALAEAKGWIATHPARFIQLCLERVGWYWFYPEAANVRSLGSVLAFTKAALGWIFTALGFVGVWYLYRRDRLVFTVVATTLIVVPLPDYFVHVGLRHQYTIEWLLVLLAALTVWNWWTRPNQSSAPLK